MEENHLKIRSPKNKQSCFSPEGALLLALILALAIGLGWAVWLLPTHSSGLSEQVLSELGNSGVSNQVTGVLLNFRGYDTLLEVGVLFLALLCTWAMGTAERAYPQLPAGPLLKVLEQVLIPLMVLVAGYLLWTGKHAPGGAFQAGAILGGAGVLYLLSDIRVGTKLLGWSFRTILIIGPVVFLAVAIGPTMIGGRLLEYPQNWAGALILLIEAAVAVSTAFTLALLFAGGRPADRSESASNSNGRKHPTEQMTL